jgi:hypothetical protein
LYVSPLVPYYCNLLYKMCTLAKISIFYVGHFVKMNGSNLIKKLRHRIYRIDHELFLTLYYNICLYAYRLKRRSARLYPQLFVVIDVICVCLHIVVSDTYCVVFLFYRSLSCVSNVTSFSGLSIFDCPFVSRLYIYIY